MPSFENNFPKDRQTTKTEATQEMHQMRHEHYLMRQKIHELENDKALLEGVRNRAMGGGEDPHGNLQVVNLEQFLALFGQGQSNFDKLAGDTPAAKPPESEQMQSNRTREQEKYEMIYNGRRPIVKYGATEHWQGIWNRMLRMNIQSLCDLGTGLGGLPRTLYRETDIKHAVGLDFAMQPHTCHVSTHSAKSVDYALRLLRAPAHEIPFPDDTFEWVTSFDMMEHLLPEEVDEVIAEMARCASKGLLFSISYVPSYLKSGGTPLHITIEPRSWWVKTIRRVTGWNMGHYNKYIIASKGPLPSEFIPPVEMLYDKPAPEEVVLLGKGPSLDRWDGSETDGRMVWAINEAMTEKNCDYGIYSDVAMRKLDPPKTVGVIRPAFLETAQEGCEQFVYDRAEFGSQTCSTASIALMILSVWGVKKVTMVGFDAYDSPIGPVYADCVSNMISKRASSDFSFVNETISDAIKAGKLDVVWWHRKKTANV